MVSQTSYRLISSKPTRDIVVPPPIYIRDPEIDSLPLVSDHRGHWFPLDAVILDDPHVHERFGNMVRDLKRRDATLLSLPLTEQKKYGKEFIDMIATAKVKVKGVEDDRTVFTTSVKDEDVDYMAIPALHLLMD